MIDALKQGFIEEATELLHTLESSLLELEANPEDQELIAKVFRALHTIKGSAGMFGYDDITMFTHDIETVYDFIRKGEIKITKEIIDLTLNARDQILTLLFQKEHNRKSEDKTTKTILIAFRNIILEYTKNTISTPEKEQTDNKVIQSTIPAMNEIYLIKFTPSRDILLTGMNPLLLLNEIRNIGSAIILASINDVPNIDVIDSQKCYLGWEIILKTNKGIDAIKDVFIFVEDQCEINISKTDKNGKLIDANKFNEFESQCLENVITQSVNIENWLNEFEATNSSVIPNKSIPIKETKTKLTTENHNNSDTVSSIRVSADKLDNLVNLVGELVTIQAGLSQLAAQSTDTIINTLAEQVERITWSLRDSALNIRMMPIGSTFNKFNRLVRDLSKELGKVIELTTEGAETELDKTVIEKLNDPLIHIIRNCIDHGIESPVEREKSGKSRTGNIHLTATQSGGNVLITIKDDGAGLDKEAIKKKAIKTGLIVEGSELTDAEIFSLIFAPGFSTASQVTNVSGRGVGMDVVRRAIDGLRGTVEVTSKPKTGTTITLKLPLTLAIIDGLLVKIQDDHYILPLSSVEECIELSDSDIEKVHGRHIINVRGGIVPYINLRESFNMKGKKPSIEQIVITTIYGNKVGFVVDNVLGQHQTVLKSLGKMYKDIEGVSGATILGDGTVALILDIFKLVANEESKSVKTHNMELEKV